MLGFIYLLLCFGLGWAICTLCFPGLHNITQSTYDNRPINLSPYILLLPVWFLIGVLSMTWSVYFTALLSSGKEAPLIRANAIIMPLAFIFILFTYYIKVIRYDKAKPFLLCRDKGTRAKEWIIFALVAILASILMWSTFYVSEGQLNIGVSVFSDFSPHIGMIRSFSYGNNFPTSYSHFAGEDIKYHFMFQFLAGNLEFLGMRIDYAFNILSILSFVGVFMLFYVLTLKITGRVLSGALALLFFAFRSGKALFIYISKIPKGESILKSLWNNTNFIGNTPHEDWGLWNLNVYCNQRHLAFGLMAMLFLIIMFLPHLYEMFDSIRNKKSDNLNKKNMRKRIGNVIRQVLISKDGWRIKSLVYPLSLGIILGSLSFFHGAAVIGCLLVLFAIAIFSSRRLEFLITAVVTVLISLIQSSLFIDGSAVTPKLLFGFIAENKTLFGVMAYLDELLGVLILVIVLAFIFGRNTSRYLIIAFTLPLIFAFTVSLTVDVTVNHKYIMMSAILLCVPAASLITRILYDKRIILKFTGLLLIVMMTATGIYDFITVLAKNSREARIMLDMEHPVTDFVRYNSDSNDIFLTDSYTINQVVLGGAMLYQGHQYYAWSAGYDTRYRDTMVARMYEANSPTELNKLVNENNISFIIIDYGNRYSTEYKLNEENIRATYECVYESGNEDWDILIFDTSKRVY